MKSMPGQREPSARAGRRAMITSVKMILFRRSGTLNMFFRLESVLSMERLLAWCPNLPGWTVWRSSTENSSPHAQRLVRALPLAGGRPWPNGRRQDVHAAARGLDGRSAEAREAVGGHRHGVGQLTPPEHLDQAVLVDQAGGPEASRG